MNKDETRRFDCPVLGGVARIVITRYYMKSDEMPQPVFRKEEFKDCNDVLRCGITSRVGNILKPDWTKCPAHPDYIPPPRA